MGEVEGEVVAGSRELAGVVVEVVEVVEVVVVALRVEVTAGERGKVSDTEKMLIKEFYNKHFIANLSI